MSDQELLNQALKEFGLQPTVELTRNGIRWNLHFEQDPAFPDLGQNMIRLERYLQLRSKRPVDLRLESETDRNKREKRNVLWTKTV